MSDFEPDRPAEPVSAPGPLLSRRRLLVGAGAGMAGLYLAACGSSGSESATGSAGTTDEVTLNWLTWNDHYLNRQLADVDKQTGIGARPQLFQDNSDAYLKVKQTGGQFDMVSGDAMWVPKFVEDGLTKSFDLGQIDAASELYSVAREFPFWQDGSNYMGYPVGWSSQQLYYDPRHVSVAPDSWEALTDPAYKGRIVLYNSASDLVAIGGIATGAQEPYSMSDDEIAAAREYLKAIKPNVLKLGAQASDMVTSLVDGSAWIVLNNLGTDLLVKEAGGPDVESVTPREGTIGFMDAEQLVASSTNEDAVMRFLDAAQRADYIAENFMENGRPLFNEKAYKLLVDQGHQERADRFLYNDPEAATRMTLKGPSENEQAYTDAFNEVFGA